MATIRHQELSLQTGRRIEWVDITSRIRDILSDTPVGDGVCTVASLHTTAGLTINENADPNVGRDLLHVLDRLVPRSDSAYRHAEGNSDSHVKASLVGFSAYVPFRDRQLVLGTWQSVYFCEFDGPRSRRVMVTVVGE